MRCDAMFVRVVAVALLVLGCMVGSAAPVAAAEEGQTTVQAPADEGGVIQMLIEWVESVVGAGPEPADRTAGPISDPSG